MSGILFIVVAVSHRQLIINLKKVDIKEYCILTTIEKDETRLPDATALIFDDIATRSSYQSAIPETGHCYRRMQLKVKTLTGKEISVDVDSSETVYHIKELLEEKEGIPPSQQKLIFQGKQMYVIKNILRGGNVSKTLTSYTY
ncbi:unnamed protein product [Kluyveromyces dobzhanskii CBS 2104]|uniref:WGS project CCBQ000000000 data, contig 00058 n=1 Tax=Kluyveromyces dobzhanskii CBS 2104 TaxID=1427455 RepID=A0A0A8LBC0_9SACH|nr:unnamed protein product [Kluyveromyces dobzhanskii CBS 2104]